LSNLAARPAGRLGRDPSAAALRISASARLVSEVVVANAEGPNSICNAAIAQADAATSTILIIARRYEQDSNQGMPLMDREISRRPCALSERRPEGFAKLTTMAFDGARPPPLPRQLIGRLVDGKASAGEGLDLSLINTVLG